MRISVMGQMRDGLRPAPHCLLLRCYFPALPVRMFVIITCPVGVVLTVSGATMFVFNVDVVVDVVPMVLTLALAIGVTAPDTASGDGVAPEEIVGVMIRTPVPTVLPAVASGAVIAAVFVPLVEPPGSTNAPLLPLTAVVSAAPPVMTGTGCELIDELTVACGFTA